MIVKEAYLVNTNHYAYRCNEIAKIKNIVYVQPTEQHQERLCYLVEYADGVKDFVAVKDATNYKLISEQNNEFFIDKETQ